MTAREHEITGDLKFLTGETPSSLYRNDEVRMARDEKGNFISSTGIRSESRQLKITDARQLSSCRAMTLSKNGFELLNAPVADYDFLDQKTVTDGYYRDCEALVAEATGAKVWAFDHNIRSADGLEEKRRVAGGQDVQGPAHIVHGDYTLRSASERLHQLTQAPSVNDTLKNSSQAGGGLIPKELALQALERGGRFAIINVWRNIDAIPVATHPLALCDGQTVQPRDLVVFEIHMPDRIGENYWAKYDLQQTFYTYPGMTRDEALLIKQWDSEGQLAKSEGASAEGEAGPCTFSLHSAFNDSQTPDGSPDRWSIEVRCIALYL